jgi:hypothetical protein
MSRTIPRTPNLNRRRRSATAALEGVLSAAVAWNIAERVVYVRGLLPWRSEPEDRPWTEADDGAAHLWLSVPIGSRFVYSVVRLIAHRNPFLPSDSPVPSALAELIQDGARWCWRVRCPYCKGTHLHQIIGSRSQQRPRAALGFRMHPCNSTVQGARGYTLIEQVSAAVGTE